jgi:hypothetical protein
VRGRKVARHPIWIGRQRTGLAAPGPGRPRIWADLANVRRPGPFFFFLANQFSLFAKYLQVSKNE